MKSIAAYAMNTGARSQIRSKTVSNTVAHGLLGDCIQCAVDQWLTRHNTQVTCRYQFVT